MGTGGMATSSPKVFLLLHQSNPHLKLQKIQVKIQIQKIQKKNTSKENYLFVVPHMLFCLRRDKGGIHSLHEPQNKLLWSFHQEQPHPL